MSQSESPQSVQPVLALMCRYRAVLLTAWAARKELAGPKRLADEAAFLPAALSIQETPVHPAPRRAAWAIMALFTLAFVWSIVGQIDIVAVAPGRIVISDRSKIVQPLEAAVVKAIRVKDGDKVLAGQVLVELDPTIAMADSRSVAEQLKVAQGEARRSAALLAALRNGGSGAGVIDPAEPQLQAEWADIAARLARLDAEALRRQAEVATVTELLAKLRTTVPMARLREKDFSDLAEKGFVAGHAGQDRTRERVELERDLATQQARLAEAQATLAESRQSRVAYLAETQRVLSDRHAKANQDVEQFRQQGTKAAQRQQLAVLVSPVAGTVQQLAVHSAGGVVTPAQTLMVIVPEGAELTAEVTVDNKDIGFVHEGQAVEVKLETFSFTRYGTVAASLVRVSGDAVNDDKRGAVFPATLRFDRDVINVDGKPIRLAPGMNVTAEVKTGRRRVIDFLLSPIQQAVDQSLKER